MIDAVRRYATRILLVHLGLLLVVLLLVLGAARQVQLSARDEAQTQSKERLQLLADQTARGLETHYVSILSDLDVILHDASTTTAPSTAASATATSRPVESVEAIPPAFPFGPGGGRAAARGRGTGQPGGRGAGGRFFPGARGFLNGPVVVNDRTLNTLWRQLKGRVSQLFLVNRAAQRVMISFPDNSQAAANTLVAANFDWIRSVKDMQMSGFKLADPDAGGERGAYHLIAIPAADVGIGGRGGGPGMPPGRGGQPGGGPFGGGPGGTGGNGEAPRGSGPPPGGRGGLFPEAGGLPPATAPGDSPYAVVVVVPINNVREQFLDPLNEEEHEVNAVLVNDAAQVLVSSSQRAVGGNLLDELDPYARAKLAPLVQNGNAQPVVIDRWFTSGPEQLAPQIVASAQLEVPSGHHWTVLISSPLSDADSLVNRIFGNALAWAIFVTLSITGILVSTAAFLIRSRVRLERTRHEMLTREVEQARQIQLAWLPDLKSAPPGVEVSAANLPASHISGDFYNWFRLPGSTPGTEPSGKVAIVIGDVTGHGMAAAFLMATTQLLVRMTLLRYQDPGRCLSEVNKQLCLQGFQGQFVTMLVIVLDPGSNTIEVATAGHPTPLVERDGSFESLAMEPHLVLGVEPGEQYKTEGYVLKPGASVLLYTDGVVEAENETGKQYGVASLIQVLQKQSAAVVEAPAPMERIRVVLEDVKQFCGRRELMDDVTLVAIRLTPPVAAGAPGDVLEHARGGFGG